MSVKTVCSSQIIESNLDSELNNITGIAFKCMLKCISQLITDKALPLDHDLYTHFIFSYSCLFSVWKAHMMSAQVQRLFSTG